jgi:cobalt-zinc-cadmium efflux system outer membrane protein
MIRFGLLTLCCLGLTAAMAQNITLTSSQIEAMFLEQNLELIAEQMNVSIADAAIAEAKVWDNPEFSIGDMNVWSAGSESQFSIELTQMVSLSARRAKLANMEKVGKEIAIKEFEELLRGLKAELRISIAEIVYMQNFLKVIESQKKFLEEVIDGYRQRFFYEQSI